MSARNAHSRPLLTPGRIGTLELRNRVVLTLMGTNQERSDGRLGDGAWPEAMGPDGIELGSENRVLVVAAEHVVWASGLVENAAAASLLEAAQLANTL